VQPVHLSRKGWVLSGKIDRAQLEQRMKDLEKMGGSNPLTRKSQRDINSRGGRMRLS